MLIGWWRVIRNQSKRLVEALLRDYPKLDSYIKDVEEDILTYNPYPDENVGGGKSGIITKPQEERVVRLEDDKQLRQLKRQERVIRENFEEADKDTQTIIRELYFNRYPTYTLEGLCYSHLIFCGKTKAQKLKIRFLKNIALELDLP